MQDGICFLCWGLNLNSTIFSHRINYYIQNSSIYNVKSIYEESFDFFESISLEYYENNILNRLITLEELRQRDEIPFGDSTPPNREDVLRNLDAPTVMEEDDDLPF